MLLTYITQDKPAWIRIRVNSEEPPLQRQFRRFTPLLKNSARGSESTKAL